MRVGGDDLLNPVSKLVHTCVEEPELIKPNVELSPEYSVLDPIRLSESDTIGITIYDSE